jgi:RNA polymerase sigma factor (sigma-70 family)
VARNRVNTVVEHLCQVVQGPEEAQATDAQLLGAFITRQDQAAFAALVRRHGPMVLGVCRRALGNHHDAEDAFQAAFLVLAKKAGSIRPRRLVANWLHGVACNTARKAKAMVARRRSREGPLALAPEPEVVPPGPWLDLRPLLDQELRLLPEKYRLPIVLCHLEGLTLTEAARQLGWPQGTVAGRLARGRDRLARRLAGAGLAVPVSLLAGAWPAQAGAAHVPPPLALSTVHLAGAAAAGRGPLAAAAPAQVVALTEGVLRAMFLTRLRALGVALVAVFFLLGATAWAYQALAPKDEAPRPAGKEGPPPPVGERPPRKAPAVEREAKKPKADRELFQGSWRLVKVERYGLTWVVKENGDLVRQDKTPTAFPIDLEVPRLARFSGDTFIEELPKGEDATLVERSTFRLDTSRAPKRITTSRKGEVDRRGIYELKGDSLRVCWNIVWGKLRDGYPPGFDTKANRKADMDTEVWHLRRERK